MVPFFSSVDVDITSTYNYGLPTSQSYYSPTSSSSASFFSNSTLTVMDNKKLGELESFSSATGAGAVGLGSEMSNSVVVTSLPSTGIVCGRTNSLPFDSSTTDLIYLETVSASSDSGLYTPPDTGLSTTAKLLSSSAALCSPMAMHSPHRLTPLGCGQINSPLISPSPNSTTSASHLLPPVSTFMFPSSIRSDGDWWDKNEPMTSSNLVTAKLVSSSTSALCDSDVDYYHLLNGTEYSLSHASTTAAL